jgi:PHD/YefM family antitoxin component YafN of YafNO toxin-antitoxin module
LSRKESTRIVLSEQQKQAVKNGEALRVALSEIGAEIVLMRATEYESIREMLDDLPEQQAVLRYSMKQAKKVAEENPS